MLKYVEKHDDSPEVSSNPWTIRQTVIYQRFDCRSLQSNHIFVRLSMSTRCALQDVLQSDHDAGEICQFISRWGSIHVLFLRTLNENWRQYINYLDGEVESIVRPCVPNSDMS